MLENAAMLFRMWRHCLRYSPDRKKWLIYWEASLPKLFGARPVPRHAFRMNQVFSDGLSFVTRQSADRSNAQPLSLQLFDLLHVFPAQHRSPTPVDPLPLVREPKTS